ncbi:GNAT family N-acetyltransferase [Burkholderia pseudomallei]|uniref:GNAT family N-acetyltransferase n=1 Tax=Burkholderia pseudomallei TaxID=28450 RepID=UPI00217F9CB9|nr:GNAT family N-acetyltransferase [Burkholderia pseudomallei]
MHAFLRVDAYWSRGIPRDGGERVIAGSLCFGAYLDAGLVGFARLVADHAAFAYRCDVFVPNEHRGKGDGRALIDRVFAQDAVRALRRVARVTSDAHALYRPAGFTALAHPPRWMELHRPGVYAQPPAGAPRRAGRAHRRAARRAPRGARGATRIQYALVDFHGAHHDRAGSRTHRDASSLQGRAVSRDRRRAAFGDGGASRRLRTAVA